MQETLQTKEFGLPASLRKLKTALKYPGAFFRYQAAPVRSFYHNFSRLAHLRTYAARCNSQADPYSSRRLSILDGKAYALFKPDQLPQPLTSEVIAEIRKRISGIDIEAVRRNAKKPYLLSLIKSEEVMWDSAIYKFVTHPEIVGCVSRYLGCFPLLTYIAVWYSPNLPGAQTGSQKFHLDHEDYRQIKGFLFVEDIGSGNGPFTLLPADESMKVQKGVNYKMTPGEKQVDDEEVYKYATQGSAVPLTGSAGTLGLVDTSRCFHYGSREGKNPRVLLTFQYMTPFAYVMPWRWRKNRLLGHLHGNNLSPLERKLLGIDI